MKYARQFIIILLISLAGELLNHFIPLQIPASIYGLVILFICLKTKLVKLSAVRETGRFFIDILPILFVAPGVAIISAMDEFKKYWWQLLLITVISTLAVFFVSGQITQLIIRVSQKRRDKKSAAEEKSE